MPLRRDAADIVITNGRIRTLDPQGSTFESIALKDGVIVGLGTSGEIEPLVDRETRVLDATGRTVLPAFTDTHQHFHSAMVARFLSIDYEELKPSSLASVLDPIKKRAISLPPGAWIQGNNFNEHHLAEQRFPNRWEIDEIAPDHPTVIWSIGNHMAAANSLALRAGGISRETSDPPGGKIDRDEMGEPSGVLRERAKLPLDPQSANSAVPPFTPEQRFEAVRAGVRLLHENGIASIHAMIRQPIEIVESQRLRDLERIRIQLLVRGLEAQFTVKEIVHLGLMTGFGDDWLRLGGVKLSVDGADIWKNAAVYDAYPGELHNCGIVRIEPDELNHTVDLCNRSGLRVAVHAIGQRAVDLALDAFEHALTANPRGDHRHRVEHAYLPPRPGQFDRMARLGILLSTQPSFIESFGDGWRHVFGEANLRGAMPLRTALSAGVRVHGNSDFACSPLNPFVGLKSAVARRTRSGAVVDPEQAVSVDEALRMLIVEPAYSGFEEHKRGTLELGKLADIVVVSQDPYTTPANDLDQIQVDTTIVGGEIVFDRAGEVEAGRPLTRVG